MSKRSNWCEFSQKERKAIYERDQGCIITGSQYMCEVAHVFIPRSAGGVGNRLNGVVLSKRYHQILDSEGAHEQYEFVKRYCENYLYKHYGDIDKAKLKYNKWQSYAIQ